MVIVSSFLLQVLAQELLLLMMAAAPIIGHVPSIQIRPSMLVTFVVRICLMESAIVV